MIVDVQVFTFSWDISMAVRQNANGRLIACKASDFEVELIEPTRPRQKVIQRRRLDYTLAFKITEMQIKTFIQALLPPPIGRLKRVPVKERSWEASDKAGGESRFWSLQNDIDITSTSKLALTCPVNLEKEAQEDLATQRASTRSKEVPGRPERQQPERRRRDSPGHNERNLSTPTMHSKRQKLDMQVQENAVTNRERCTTTDLLTDAHATLYETHEEADYDINNHGEDDYGNHDTIHVEGYWRQNKANLDSPAETLHGASPGEPRQFPIQAPQNIESPSCSMHDSLRQPLELRRAILQTKYSLTAAASQSVNDHGPETLETARPRSKMTAIRGRKTKLTAIRGRRR